MSKHFNTTDSESKKKTICVPAFSFALVFSTAYVVGYSFNKDLSFSWCTQNSVLAAALLLILMILAYHLCKMLFKASAPFSKSDGSKQIARQLNARRSLLLFALLFFIMESLPTRILSRVSHQRCDAPVVYVPIPKPLEQPPSCAINCRFWDAFPIRLFGRIR